MSEKPPQKSEEERPVVAALRAKLGIPKKEKEQADIDDQDHRASEN